MKPHVFQPIDTNPTFCGMCGNREQSVLHLTPITPVFEPGKTYRTVNGKAMRMERYDWRLIGRQADAESPFRVHSLVYELNGHPVGNDWNGWQLLPGAIEDEKRDDPPEGDGWRPGDPGLADPVIVTHGALRKELADINGRMRNVAESLRDRIAGNEHEGENVKRRLDELDNYIGYNLNFINMQRGRIEKLEEATRRAGIDLAGRIKNVGGATAQRLDDIGKQFGQDEERMDNLEKHCEAMQAAIAHIRLDVVNDQRPFSTAPRLRAVMDAIREDMAEAKPVIKGGWVNVYRYPANPTTHISPIIFQSRAECDYEGVSNRVACIQIPDFKEGEGL